MTITLRLLLGLALIASAVLGGALTPIVQNAGLPQDVTVRSPSAIYNAQSPSMQAERAQFTPEPGLDYADSDIIKRLSEYADAVAMLGGANGRCTAAAIGPHLWLTADHCNVLRDLTIRGEPAEFLDSDGKRQLVKSEWEAPVYFEIPESRSYEPGDRLYIPTIYPYDEAKHVLPFTGQILDGATWGDSGDFSFSGASMGGFSGGPILARSDGKFYLIGLVNASLLDPYALSYGVTRFINTDKSTLHLGFAVTADLVDALRNQPDSSNSPFANELSEKQAELWERAVERNVFIGFDHYTDEGRLRLALQDPIGTNVGNMTVEAATDDPDPPFGRARSVDFRDYKLISIEWSD